MDALARFLVPAHPVIAAIDASKFQKVVDAMVDIFGYARIVAVILIIPAIAAAILLHMTNWLAPRHAERAQQVLMSVGVGIVGFIVAPNIIKFLTDLLINADPITPPTLPGGAIALPLARLILGPIGG
jgi:hypothetical protein